MRERRESQRRAADEGNVTSNGKKDREAEDQREREREREKGRWNGSERRGRVRENGWSTGKLTEFLPHSEV